LHNAIDVVELAVEKGASVVLMQGSSRKHGFGDLARRVTEEDVRAAPADQREWLRERLGRSICSVVQEDVAQQISQEGQRQGFAPSVPFVACLSACMVVGELIKSAAGWTTPLETHFQFDALRGPAYGELVPQEKRRGCECGTRAGNIEKWRRLR
jgi:hypothetical protein